MTNRAWRAAVLAVVAGVCGCGGPPNAEVRHFGALHAMMMEGDTSSKVLLADAASGPHVYGVGALSMLRGEVTIVDGAIWRSYATDDGVRTERGDPGDEGAALLVHASVRNWRSVPAPETIEHSGLDAWIASVAEKQGLDPDRPFFFLIEGAFPRLDMHVVDGRKLRPGAGHAEHRRSAIQLDAANTVATIVGVRSRHHEAVFTHRGDSLHMHAVVPEMDATGHVDAIMIPRGAVLRVPAM